MAKSLHLHIGMPKAASTTLQALLLANRGRLQARGYAYPMPIPGRVTGNAMPLTLHFTRNSPAARQFQFHNPGVLDFEDPAEFFERTYMGNGCGNLILSSEGFCRAAQVHDYSFLFSRFAEVKVHLVLRPKTAWLESQYFQRVKIGNLQGEFGEMLAAGQFDRPIRNQLAYARAYRFWRDLAGPENVKLHFLGSRFGAIEDQFLKALLGEVPADFERPPRHNEALGIAALAAIARLPAGGLTVKSHWQASRQILGSARKLGLTGKAPVLLPELHSALTARFDADDRAFAAMQDRITLADLQPGCSASMQQATTLEAVRETAEYARLRSHLKEHHGLLV